MICWHAMLCTYKTETIHANIITSSWWPIIDSSFESASYTSYISIVLYYNIIFTIPLRSLYGAGPRDTTSMNRRIWYLFVKLLLSSSINLNVIRYNILTITFSMGRLDTIWLKPCNWLYLFWIYFHFVSHTNVSKHDFVEKIIHIVIPIYYVHNHW